MYQSDQIDQIAPALVAAQGAMGHAKKESENPHYRSRYADLASVREAVAEPLYKNGLCAFQYLVLRAEPLIIEKDRQPVQVLADLHTKLLHTSGQWFESVHPIAGDWSDPPKIGTAIKYARRYNLEAICGIAPVDGEDDAASISASRVERPRQQQRPAQQQQRNGVQQPAAQHNGNAAGQPAASASRQPFDEFSSPDDEVIDEGNRRLAEKDAAKDDAARQAINQAFPQPKTTSTAEAQPQAQAEPQTNGAGAADQTQRVPLTGTSLLKYIDGGPYWNWFRGFAEKNRLDIGGVANWPTGAVSKAYAGHQAALKAHRAAAAASNGGQ